MLVCIFLWTVFSYISVCNVSSNGSWTRGMYAGGVSDSGFQRRRNPTKSFKVWLLLLFVMYSSCILTVFWQIRRWSLSYEIWIADYMCSFKKILHDGIFCTVSNIRMPFLQNTAVLSTVFHVCNMLWSSF